MYAWLLIFKSPPRIVEDLTLLSQSTGNQGNTSHWSVLGVEKLKSEQCTVNMHLQEEEEYDSTGCIV